MLRFTRKAAATEVATVSLTLALDQRTRGRLRVTLDDGAVAGLFLERGGILRNGDKIATEDGVVAQVVAAREPVSTVRCGDRRLLARACYHLGNRHLPLQIEDGWIRYQSDHVLDELIRGLGLTPVSELAPFEPESGAYSGGDLDGGHGHHH